MAEPTGEKLPFANKPIALADKLLTDLGFNKNIWADRQYILQAKEREGKTPQEALNDLADLRGLNLILCVTVAPDNPLVKQWGEGIGIRTAFFKSAQMEINRSSTIIEQYKNGDFLFTSKETINKHEKHIEILKEFQADLFTEISPTAPALKK